MRSIKNLFYHNNSYPVECTATPSDAHYRVLESVPIIGRSGVVPAIPQVYGVGFLGGGDAYSSSSQLSDVMSSDGRQSEAVDSEY